MLIMVCLQSTIMVIRYNILRLFNILPSETERGYELVIKMVYRNCLPIFQTTQDLGSWEIRKYQETIETSWN